MRWLALLVLLVACGSSDEPMLHFTGRSETESNFQRRIELLAEQNPLLFLEFCGELTGKSPAAAAEVIRGEPDGSIPPGSTPMPGQRASQASMERAAVMVQEHCDRTFAG